ncbi:MAG: ribonuclease Y [Clostridia bacterium]|nr:ribonuclease Y [Clostridia bacterium]
MTLSMLGDVSSLVAVVIGVGATVAGIIGGFLVNQLMFAKKVGKSKSNAAKILEEAYAEAKITKKEAILEAKDEVHKLRIDFDKEIKDRRSEVQRLEDRITQREEFIEKKELALDKKQEQVEETKQNLQKKEQDIDKSNEEQKKVLNSMREELEKVSRMTKEEAKQTLINTMVDDAKLDAAKTVKEIEENAKNDGNKKAQDILATVIQKCASDFVAENTVSAVALPNDEIKGRIIGREGRNIRTLEAATGVDLIVDDTPETITISCFDPIRREVARMALEKLILDGRIHPTRIEELVIKAQKDIDQKVKEEGENASNDAGVYNLHPELVKVLGRLKYRTSYGQNVLKHSLETSYIAGLLAAELGADEKTARRGGLLHDIGKALDHEIEGTHTAIGVDLAKKYKETPAVIHCIEAHHFDVEFKSVEAVLVQIADAISSSRPGARRETIESYVKRLSQLEEIASSFKGVEKSFAVQAGREVRIIVKPEEISDDMAVFLAKDIAKKIEEEMEYPGQIKVNVIRESRFIETAK